MISTSERNFIQLGIDSGIRADGRDRLETKPSCLELGLIPQASGSCRISVHNGSSVLVGIKVAVEPMEVSEMGEDVVEQGESGETVPDDSLLTSREMGKIICSVECSKSVTKSLDSRQLQTLTSEYSEFLNRIFNGPQGGIDLKSLCIIPGSLCWVIYVDALILEYSGNMLDTLFAGVRGALYNTRMPQVNVESSEGHFEFDVADEETEVVKGRENMPISITFNKVGNRYILDASPMEELCSEASLTLCFNPQGQICSLKKSGMGGIEPSLMTAIFQAARPFGQACIKRMTVAMEREELRLSSCVLSPTVYQA